MSLTSNTGLPMWFVRTAEGELHGYFTREILLCDLATNKDERVTILELVPGMRVSYRPISREALKAVV